jgi:hypothetical protein
VDTRQNASFAIKLPKRKRKKDTFYTIQDGYDFSGYDPERHEA